MLAGSVFSLAVHAYIGILIYVAFLNSADAVHLLQSLGQRNLLEGADQYYAPIIVFIVFLLVFLILSAYPYGFRNGGEDVSDPNQFSFRKSRKKSDEPIHSTTDNDERDRYLRHALQRFFVESEPQAS